MKEEYKVTNTKGLKEILFKKEGLRFPLSLGRNGYIQGQGVAICSAGMEIEFMPITTKNRFGRCIVAIPKGSIDEVIEKLKQLKEEL